ncbi:hypothetical protein QYE76_015055 [Lolium multiflorum]|uniref:Uncharacterized protein n=1 Tax=Lolium multiflorum TaxID=4521 RepID=A0AAD8X623_LOLMU|nr:hypothetical protein QYE76_015055 [Lolium multiflorum]
MVSSPSTLLRPPAYIKPRSKPCTIDETTESSVAAAIATPRSGTESRSGTLPGGKCPQGFSIDCHLHRSSSPLAPMRTSSSPSRLGAVPELDTSGAGGSESFFQDANRHFTIRQVLVDIHRSVIDVLEHLRLLRHF